MTCARCGGRMMSEFDELKCLLCGRGPVTPMVPESVVVERMSDSERQANYKLRRKEAARQVAEESRPQRGESPAIFPSKRPIRVRETGRVSPR